MDAELLCQCLVGVDIDLDEAELAVIFVGLPLEDWSQGLARTAPLSPEVDDDRMLVAALENFEGKLWCVYLNYVWRIHSRECYARIRLKRYRLAEYGFRL